MLPQAVPMRPHYHGASPRKAWAKDCPTPDATPETAWRNPNKGRKRAPENPTPRVRRKCANDTADAIRLQPVTPHIGRNKLAKRTALNKQHREWRPGIFADNALSLLSVAFRIHQDQSSEHQEPVLSVSKSSWYQPG